MSKVAKATIGLMIATMIAKILGFVRELVLASSYGLSIYSDAYITAMNIPTIIFTAIGGSLGTVLIPLYFDINNISVFKLLTFKTRKLFIKSPPKSYLFETIDQIRLI